MYIAIGLFCTFHIFPEGEMANSSKDIDIRQKITLKNIKSVTAH